MQTSAAGNNNQHLGAAYTARHNRKRQAPRFAASRFCQAHGFTLLELLVVLSIVAVTTAVVTLSFRENSQAVLERDALRLVGLLESARARSRESATPVFWFATSDGFRFEGLLPAPSPEKWLEPDTSVIGNTRLQLGPESFIGAQTLQLSRTQESQDPPGSTLEITTDGLRPFRVQTTVLQ